ncbi:MAG TPA: hypothetical protein VKZ81_17810 [Pseudonocardia sp.]|jgi:hypothetical protein|uniref:hypothetical protein n=1 Tax=Pseudonocardia sp. TaxID=60912 RepID=UPI002B4B4D81|nr:hypothetical protein [Pseudonocardia sp.]HLU57314.1 hypothetical protein [Pseudonocardia sp.]
MHPHRLQQLVASVPDSVDAEQRARLLAHVQASDRCRVRIERVGAELERALDGVGNSDRVVDLVVELDGLERAQQRVDRRLTALIDELTSTPRAVAYDDGVPA